MRTSRSHLPTRTADDELLDGHGPDTPLAWLLAVAAAPGRAEEIEGEAAALAAFTAAPATTASTAAPPTPRPTLLPRLIAAKAVVLVLLAAGATGGVALAANGSFAHPPFAGPRPTSLRPAPATPTPASPTATPLPPPSSADPAVAPGPSARQAAKPCPARAACGPRTTDAADPNSAASTPAGSTPAASAPAGSTPAAPTSAASTPDQRRASPPGLALEAQRTQPPRSTAKPAAAPHRKGHGPN
jgi:hypothetical protein